MIIHSVSMCISTLCSVATTSVFILCCTESTVPVNACVRCYDVKLSGSFKCGRCGCSFKTKPVNDNSPLPIEASSSSQLDRKCIISYNHVVNTLNS